MSTPPLRCKHLLRVWLILGKQSLLTERDKDLPGSNQVAFCTFSDENPCIAPKIGLSGAVVALLRQLPQEGPEARAVLRELSRASKLSDNDTGHTTSRPCVKESEIKQYTLARWPSESRRAGDRHPPCVSMVW